MKIMLRCILGFLWGWVGGLWVCRTCWGGLYIWDHHGVKVDDIKLDLWLRRTFY